MHADHHKKSRIIIVDDHPLVREGIAMLINRETDMVVCCATDQIDSATQANRGCQHDLAIVDLTLEGFSGMEVIRKFKYEFPDTRILVLSMHAESIYAETVLKAGAQGYLMKQSGTVELLTAIRQILKGGMYVSNQMHSLILNNAARKSRDSASLSSLSSSELEVLHLIGLGLGTSEISTQISRSIKTVETHKANIKKKLHLDNASQLAQVAASIVTLGSLPS